MNINNRKYEYNDIVIYTIYFKKYRKLKLLKINE